MKTKTQALFFFAALITIAVAAASFAASPGIWAVGIRTHTDHTVAEDIPYGDADISYQVAYEVYDAGGLWQFALGLTPDVSDRENFVDTNNVMEVDQVITPEVNLLLREQYWTMGVGALMSYVDQETTNGVDETEWTDIYWQLIMGVTLPLGNGTDLKVLGYYPYQDWGDLDEIDFDDFDFGAWLTLRF